MASGKRSTKGQTPAGLEDAHPLGPPTPDADEFATWIREAWQKSVSGIIEAGQLLIRAKNELPHGQFGLLFKEKKVPFSARTGERLREIAVHPVLSNPTHGSHLPPHWRTLHALTKVPEPQLTKMLAEGTINAETERKDVERLAKHLNPARVLEAIGALSAFLSDWPKPELLVPVLLREGDIDSSTIMDELGAVVVPWLSELAAQWDKRGTRTQSADVQDGIDAEEATVEEPA